MKNTDMWTDKKQSANAGIKYCTEVLSNTLETWERKEYESVLTSYKDELLHAEKMIKVCESLS